MRQATRGLADAFTVRLRQRLDLGFLLVVAALLGLGLVMVMSASVAVSEQRFGTPFHYVVRQGLYIAVGVALAWALYEIPLRLWEVAGLALLGGTFLLLALVLVPGVGRTVNGATRWIDIGPFALQVSELAKLLVILYMAGYLVRHGVAVRERLAGFVKPLLLVGLLAGLLLAEPDFGGAVVILAVTMGMLFLGGVRLPQFALLLAIAVAVFAVLAITSPYRLQRLTSFLHPWDDPLRSGFQLTQSLIAIGSGSLTGVGLGESVQKLAYLPEAHNDFLFAILAEELGLVGVVTVVALFSYAVWRCFAIGRAAERAGHAFGAHLCYGVGLWIGIQAFVNMGVNMGVLPTKGLTLPFMSAGGSSLIAMLAGSGLVLRVHREIHDLSPLGQGRATALRRVTA